MKALNPSTVLKPTPGYSQGYVAKDVVYVAGQVGADANGGLVGPGDIAAQTKQTLLNVSNVLAAEGLGLTNVVSTTVYIKDMVDYPAFSKAWCEVFGDHAPARATVRADMVHPALLVEIQAIAVR